MLPPLRGAVRDLLLADTGFAALLAPDRVVFRQPPDVTSGFVTVQVSAQPLTGDGVAWSPRVQVDCYWPASDPEGEDRAWAIAVRAAWVLGRTRNHNPPGLSVAFSGRHTDGPLPLDDISRGSASPLTRVLVAALLTLHARR